MDALVIIAAGVVLCLKRASLAHFWARRQRARQQQERREDSERTGLMPPTACARYSRHGQVTVRTEGEGQRRAGVRGRQDAESYEEIELYTRDDVNALVENVHAFSRRESETMRRSRRLSEEANEQQSRK